MASSTKSKPDTFTSTSATSATDGLLPEDVNAATVTLDDVAAEAFAVFDTTPVLDTVEPTSADVAPFAPIQRTKKLSGEALKAYAEINQGQGLTAKQLAIGAGYVRKVQGQLVAAPNGYSAALAIAFGLAPQTASRGPGSRPGRSLNYRLKSNAISGNVMVTGAYSRELGVAPGTVFTVIVDKENGELVLQPQVVGGEKLDAAESAEAAG